MGSYDLAVDWAVEPANLKGVGAFPDASSALMLAARLRHLAGTKWGTRRYLGTKRLSSTFCDNMAFDRDFTPVTMSP